MDIGDQGGLFLAIEGASKPHVLAQVKFLAEKFRNIGLVVETILFPRVDEPAGYFSRQYLDGQFGEKTAISPYTAMLFQALDHYQAALAIRNWLNEGRIVIVSGYTGSVMADQGLKFDQPEERSGFYLWSDNMAFDVFGLPRPVKNFVLSTSSSSNKEGVEMVFQEICGLLSRDFQAVDCRRDGQILDDNIINDLLWKTLEPHIPGPLAKSLIEFPQTSVLPDLAADSEIFRAGQSEKLPQIDGISRLMSLFKLRQLGNRQIGSHDEIFAEYYIPPMKNTTTELYQKAMDQIFEIAQRVEAGLRIYLKNHVPAENSQLKVRQLRKSLLPVAALVPGNAEPGSTALLSIGEVDFLARYTERQQKLSANLSKHMPGSYGQTEKTVYLSSVWPRNELALLPYLLYGGSDLSLQKLGAVIDKWPYERKQTALIQSLKVNADDPSPDSSILDVAYYAFDILTDFSQFTDLLVLRQPLAVDWQSLTPRYGYEVPALIEEAGLSEPYLECFDLSLELFSQLQSAGYALEAQYAVLGGHKLRGHITFSTKQLVNILKTRPAEQPALLAEIGSIVAEAHPLIVDSLNQ